VPIDATRAANGTSVIDEKATTSTDPSVQVNVVPIVGVNARTS
jgi:hypothetical protein